MQPFQPPYQYPGQAPLQAPPQQYAPQVQPQQAAYAAPGYGPPQGPPGYIPTGYPPASPIGNPAYQPPVPPPQYAPQPAYAPPAPYQPPVDSHAAYAAMAGMDGTKVSEGGDYFNAAADGIGEGPGSYEIVVNDVLTKNSVKSGWGVIFEMIVVQSSNPKITPGTKRGQFIKLANAQVAHQAIIKAIAACNRLNAKIPAHREIIDTQISPRAIELTREACERKTLNGKHAIVRTKLHQTKKGQIITVLDWEPAPEAAPVQR